MDLPVQITFRQMDPSPAVEAAIRERVERLERFFDRIISARVVVEAPHRHKRKGKLYSVGVDLRVPGGEIVVKHNGPQDHAHEDVYVAIRDSFDAARRLLEDHARTGRGDTKAHEPPTHGKVARLFPFEGYGFIETPQGEVYFHKNSVTDRQFDKLSVGAEVRLAVASGESEHGAQASTVTPIGKHHIVER